MRRLRRRSFLIHRAAVLYWVLTLAVAAGSARLVQRAVAGTGTSRFGPVTAVVVVTAPVAPGRVLRRADLAVRAVPASFVPSGGVRSVEAALGRSVRRAMPAGAPLDPATLTPGPSGALAARTGPERRAMVVPVQGLALRLASGDLVDVLASADATGQTDITVSGAEVLAVGDRAVTVAVAAADAPRLAGALATRVVTLALRGG